ncbi:MAG: alpha/beta hydrolase family protein [Phycisphaerae bacterium]
MRYGRLDIFVALCMGAWLLQANIGCLSEQSFRMQARDRRRLADTTWAEGVDAGDTRAWLRSVHGQLADLLPAARHAALLTENLTDATGRPVDVFEHFHINSDRLRTLLGNFDGLRCTAQCASQDSHIDAPAEAWPGFEQVWIPLEPGLSLSGRLGLATDVQGRPQQADCIVILPGFFGDNGVRRTRDLARFLRESGQHVLALELRGHGQTEAVYPRKAYSFGVVETDDLMRVSDWLTERPEVERTGLVGFCWGANNALLAAWYDGRSEPDPSISRTIAEHLPTRPGPRRFTAGIMAFSPILRWEALEDELDVPRSYWRDPVYAAIQQTVRSRMERKNYPEPGGSLRQLIEYESAASDLPLPHGTREGHDFLRLMPYRGKPAHDKLERARTPVLIVHGSNDPLSQAQDVADFFADLSNRRVSGIILPGGGHVGFAAYAKRYHYSLIANFFDPQGGAAAFVGP